MTDNVSLEVPVRADGFVDFYEMLGVPGDAPSELINTRINALYERAQSNREHRHLAKRRESEMLLILMPQCLDVLMDGENRAAYDVYAIAARANDAPTDFDTFLKVIVKGRLQPRASILSVRGNNNAPTQNGTAKLSSSAAKTGSSIAPRQRLNSANAPQIGTRRAARAARKPNLWAASGLFAFVFVLSDLFLKMPPVVTLTLSPLAALIYTRLTPRANSSVATRQRESVSV